jgi:hypothetical protein
MRWTDVADLVDVDVADLADLVDAADAVKRSTGPGEPDMGKDSSFCSHITSNKTSFF